MASVEASARFAAVVLVALLLSAVLLSRPAGAQSGANPQNDVPPGDVIRHLRQKADASAVELSKHVERCDRLEAQGTDPSIDLQHLAQYGVGFDAARLALTYLNHRNYADCAGDARAQLAYHLRTLSKVADEYGVPDPGLAGAAELSRGLLYPTADLVELEVFYRALPAPAREHLDTSVGDRPFDLLRTLDRIRQARAE